MSSIIRAKSKESGEEYTVCQPVMITPDGKGMFLGLTQKLPRLEVPDNPEECVAALVSLEAGFGHTFEFSHVRLDSK